MVMLELQNAKEREAGDWERLFRDADPRFKLTGINQSPSARLAVIEGTWQEPWKSQDQSRRRSTDLASSMDSSLLS